jgi:sterol 3beta-glucosyltransferase
MPKFTFVMIIQHVVGFLLQMGVQGMITILSAGSRGDVQPYLALAVEIKKLGKPVRIAVTRDYKELVGDYGIEYFPIEVDMESLHVDENMIREAQKADNPLKMFFSFQKMKKYGIHMVHHYYSACEGSDLIVYHPGIDHWIFCCEKNGNTRCSCDSLSTP